MDADVAGPDTVVERVEVAGARLALRRPRSAEDLIDEAEFEQDERLPYWAEIWPASRVLADLLVRRAPRNARLLELGCGLGLPSIVAARAGADALATDWYPDALEFVRANAADAGAPVDTLHVDWRHPPPELLARAPFDLVVGADILYEERNGAALTALLPRLVHPRAEVLITDPRRPHARHLLEPLADAGWRHEVREVHHGAPRDEQGPVVRIHALRPPPHGVPTP